MEWEGRSRLFIRRLDSCSRDKGHDAVDTLTQWKVVHIYIETSATTSARPRKVKQNNRKAVYIYGAHTSERIGRERERNIEGVSRATRKQYILEAWKSTPDCIELNRRAYGEPLPPRAPHHGFAVYSPPRLPHRFHMLSTLVSFSLTGPPPHPSSFIRLFPQFPSRASERASSLSFIRGVFFSLLAGASRWGQQHQQQHADALLRAPCESSYVSFILFVEQQRKRER